MRWEAGSMHEKAGSAGPNGGGAASWRLASRLWVVAFAVAAGGAVQRCWLLVALGGAVAPLIGADRCRGPDMAGCGLWLTSVGLGGKGGC